MATPTKVTVVEYGAVPPHTWRTSDADSAEVCVLIAQQVDECQTRFLTRVRTRLDQLLASAHTLTHGRLVLSCDADQIPLGDRLALARDLVLSLDRSGCGCLELTGQLTTTGAGRAVFWELVETLAAQVSAPGVTVRALPETPVFELAKAHTRESQPLTQPAAWFDSAQALAAVS